MKWGGIVGSALAGGLAGAGQAVSAIGAQQIKSDEEKATRTWQEARDMRMKELDFGNQEQRDERLAGRQEAGDARKAEREDKRWAEQSAREEKRWEEQGIRESERERLRNEREAAREAARDKRYEESASGKNRRISVVDSEGAPRSVTQEELNAAPAGKYKLVSTDSQDRKLDSQEAQKFADRIERKEKQITNLPKRDQDSERRVVDAMRAEYQERFGKPYAGAPSNAPAGPWDKYKKGN